MESMTLPWDDRVTYSRTIDGIAFTELVRLDGYSSFGNPPNRQDEKMACFRISKRLLMLGKRSPEVLGFLRDTIFPLNGDTEKETGIPRSDFISWESGETPIPLYVFMVLEYLLDVNLKTCGVNTLSVPYVVTRSSAIVDVLRSKTGAEELFVSNVKRFGRSYKIVLKHGDRVLNEHIPPERKEIPGLSKMTIPLAEQSNT